MAISTEAVSEADRRFGKSNMRNKSRPQRHIISFLRQICQRDVAFYRQVRPRRQKRQQTSTKPNSSDLEAVQDKVGSFQGHILCFGFVIEQSLNGQDERGEGEKAHNADSGKAPKESAGIASKVDVPGESVQAAVEHAGDIEGEQQVPVEMRWVKIKRWQIRNSVREAILEVCA